MVTYKVMMRKRYASVRPGGMISRRKAGQAMTEYLIVAATLVLAVSILAVFLYTIKEHGGRVFDLVASEYP